MSDELYVDGIGDVAITGMVIRLDLVALDRSQRDDQNRPQPAVRQQVVMPIDGFLRAVQTFGKTLARLEELGVIRKNQAPGSAAEVAEKVLEADMTRENIPL